MPGLDVLQKKMNQQDLNRAFLKAFGLALLFVAILAIPRALSGGLAVFYWGYSSWNGSGEFDSIEAMARTLAANQALEGIKGILGVLVMGWVSIQVLKEKPWILRFTRIGKAEPDSDGNAEKPPGVEREP